jgi:hypothetical protein
MEEPVNHPTEPESNPTVAHEETDANTHAITQFGIGLALIVILSQLLLWWLFTGFTQRENKLSPPVTALVKAQAPTVPPEPRLQGNPQADMRTMREKEDAALNHYGWVDPNRGVVRLPIERAIELVAQKGLPQFKPAAANTGKAGSPKAANTLRARPQTPK